jgi:hypothetical protein
MKPMLARVLATMAAGMLSLALGAMLTLVLMPLWSRIEAATGIESVGHSGPASWGYVATSAVLFCGWILARAWRRRSERR